MKNKGVIGLLKIKESGKCEIEILPLQENELPLRDGQQVVILGDDKVKT
jgi:hypothetical protein